ncbi:MAG: toxin-antitoxin system YwqK family antitoxin [Parachlamydiaceae bacterium]|nr:toxin-antitoxin system YwqK family antitoxin [Parachlamydiaceae bacterium]
MKQKYLPYALVLLLLSAGCNSRRNDDVVAETYVHRYGVALPAEEWSERGQHGQVVSTMKDGVVASRNYDSGVLHGETTYSFPHRDTIQRKEIYDQGALKQEVHNYSNGLPSRQVTYNSETNQSVVEWYDNGVPQSREEYENELLQSGEYFTPANLQESTVTNQNGTRVRRDLFGELDSVEEIQDGKMAKRTTYHSNGTPETVTPYMDGKAEGKRLTYLPGGEPSTMEDWKNDKQHGETHVYENGEKYATVPYVYGKKHGVEKRYSNDGQNLAREVTWVKGNMHGPAHTYVDEEVKSSDWYFQNKQVNKQTYDALSNQ